MIISSLLVATALPAIKVEEVANGFRVLAGPFSASQLPKVDSEMALQAQVKCGRKTVRWGNASAEPVSHNARLRRIENYTRGFTCIEGEARQYVAGTAEWQPTDKDLADVKNVFTTFFRERDAGRFKEAGALMGPDGQDSFLGASDDLTGWNKKLGAGTRRIVRVTWLLNPPGMSHAGTFASVFFIGNYPSMAYYCGELVLYRRGPGSYEIVRDQQAGRLKSEADTKRNERKIAAERLSTCRA